MALAVPPHDEQGAIASALAFLATVVKDNGAVDESQALYVTYPRTPPLPDRTPLTLAVCGSFFPSPLSVLNLLCAIANET